jgi:histidine triad (HIT) family protein
MADCIFCKLINGDLPAQFVYQNEHVVAFNDINPQAPTHVLIIPRKHIATLNDLSSGDAQVMAELYLAAQQIAEDAGIAQAGYRTVVNCNLGGGQTVYHLHLHVMGGRQMRWPPG